MCRRSAPDGSSKSTLVIELTQTFWADPDKERYRGGCTLLFDLNDNTLEVSSPKKAVLAMVHAEARGRAVGGDGERRGSRTGLLPA